MDSVLSIYVATWQSRYARSCVLTWQNRWALSSSFRYLTHGERMKGNLYDVVDFWKRVTRYGEQTEWLHKLSWPRMSHRLYAYSEHNQHTDVQQLGRDFPHFSGTLIADPFNDFPDEHLHCTCRRIIALEKQGFSRLPPVSALTTGIGQPVEITHESLRNVPSLSNLSRLEVVDVNSLHDLSALTQLPSLCDLRLRKRTLGDERFPSLKQLSALTLKQCDGLLTSAPFDGGSNIRSLTLQGCNLPSLDDSLFHYLSGLTYLCLGYSQLLAGMSDEALKPLTRLESLTLRGGWDIFSNVLQYAPRTLTHLHTDGDISDQMLDQVPQLKHLAVRYHINEYMRPMSSLQSLHIQNSAALALENFPALTSLAIPHLDSVGESGFQSFSQLKFLRVNECNQDDAFRYLSQLTKLEIDDCAPANNDVFTHLTKLRVLYMRRFGRIPSPQDGYQTEAQSQGKWLPQSLQRIRRRYSTDEILEQLRHYKKMPNTMLDSLQQLRVLRVDFTFLWSKLEHIARLPNLQTFGDSYHNKWMDIYRRVQRVEQNALVQAKVSYAYMESLLYDVSKYNCYNVLNRVLYFFESDYCGICSRNVMAFERLLYNCMRESLLMDGTDNDMFAEVVVERLYGVPGAPRILSEHSAADRFANTPFCYAVLWGAYHLLSNLAQDPFQGWVHRSLHSSFENRTYVIGLAHEIGRVWDTDRSKEEMEASRMLRELRYYYDLNSIL